MYLSESYFLSFGYNFSLFLCLAGIIKKKVLAFTGKEYDQKGRSFSVDSSNNLYIHNYFK